MRNYILIPLLTAVMTTAIGQPFYAGLDSEQWYNWTDDGIRHYVFEFGAASSQSDPIVVIHGGWGAEHSYLIEPLLPLADSHRFVLFDQRGSLRTPAPESSISIDRLVADLDDLRVALGVDRVTLAAHSMGNALAFAYLAAHPDRVRGMVLISPVQPTLFLGPPNIEFVREVWPEADPAALNGAYEAFMSDFARRGKERIDSEGLLPDEFRPVPPEELDSLNIGEDRDRTRAWRIYFAAANSCTGANWKNMRGGQVFYNGGVSNAILWQDYPRYENVTETFWPALQDFNGPIRVIIGTCDYADLGPSVWPRIVERLSNAELTVIQETGHIPWMDKPENFSQTLGSVLESLVSDDSY